MTADERLEAIRKTLCGAGLHPRFYDTPEKAADAVVKMIAHFREELANPPHDVQCGVLRKMGVEGYTEGATPRLRLISLTESDEG